MSLSTSEAGPPQVPSVYKLVMLHLLRVVIWLSGYTVKLSSNTDFFYGCLLRHKILSCFTGFGNSCSRIDLSLLLKTSKPCISNSTHFSFLTYTFLHQNLGHIILGAYLPGVFHEESNGTWVSVNSWGELLESAFCHPDRPIINLESTNRERPVRFKNKNSPVLIAWPNCLLLEA